MEKRIKEIIAFGNDRNITELRRCVGNMDIKDILHMVSKYIREPQFPIALMYIFDGLTDSGQAQMARLKITEKVLEEFQKCDIPLVKAMDITSRLMHELPNFSTNHLTKIADRCVECICNRTSKSGNNSHLCWKELLPTILCLLLERVKVTHTTTNMTAEEYKTQIINSIVQAKWSCDVAVSLAGMFVNITMTSDEHLKIVNKLCSYIEELSPQELPPLAHEMLEFCHERHAMQLIMRLNFYFHSRLYRKVLGNTENVRMGTQLMHFDSEDISAHSVKELRDAESTILSYIRKSASQHASIAELVNIMKKLSCRSPEYVLQPFIMSMLFSIGTLRTYEDQVFQILKSALQRCLVEEQMKIDSAWMKELNVEPVNLGSLFNSIIEGSKCGQPDAEEGLVNLAFILLQYKAVPNQEALADSLWGYGTSILVQLCKRQRHVTGSVLQRLSDFIITGSSVLQFTRCLAEMCAKLRLVVLEKQTLIIDLVANVYFFAPSVARNVVVAVMPIVLLAPSVCNNLILTLRKAAFSRDVNTRKMSVYGFLEMLKNFKIEGTSGNHLSQGSAESAFSGYTVLSQVAVEVHSQAQRSSGNSKEAVCLEVLNALRGFLSMQAEVKACLFGGLVSAVRANPGLTGPVLSWLHRHLSKQCDLDNLPPLRFQESVSIKSSDAVLQEPLAALVLLAQEVFAFALKMDSEDRNECEHFSVLQGILDKLVARMARCSCDNFGIEVDINLSDTDAETKMSAEVLRQALGVYEALMNYVISAWSVESKDPADKVLSLFKCHAGLVELAKTSTKAKKELDATAKSQLKKGKGRPSRTSSFKLPPSILGLSFLKRSLALLYDESVSWSTCSAANSLKGKLDFQLYVANVLSQFVGQLHSEVALTGNLNVLYQCTVLCRVLYPRVALRINEIDANSRQVAVQLLESFTEMFKIVVTHFKKKLPSFLEEITEVDEKDGVAEQLSGVLATIHTTLQEVLAEDDKSESIDARFAELLVESLATLSLQLPPGSQQCSKVSEWVRDFATQRELSNKYVVKNLVNLLFALTARTKTESSVLPNVIIKLKEELTILPDLEEDDAPSATVSYPIVSSATKEIVLQAVCTLLRCRIEEVEWVTNRATAELTMLDHQPGEAAHEASFERLKDIERDLVCHLGQCVRCCVSLSACTPPEGALTNTMLRLYGDIYKAVTLVAKYFKFRCANDHKAFEAVRFDKVIKLAGKGFSKHVFEFISYIGEKHDKSQRKTAEASKQKKILRETRYIPIVVRKKEELDQSVIVLAKQCKAAYLGDLVRYNVARDFNIRAEKLEKALEKSDDPSNDTTRDDEGSGEEEKDDSAENEASRSPIMSSPVREEEDEEEDEDDKVGSDRAKSSSSEDDEVKPPPKKKRLSRAY